MPFTGDVQITVLDGQAGVVVVPASQVQAVLGCSSSGTVNQVVATRSTRTLKTNFAAGPLPEAAGLAVQAGGTVLAMRVATATAGAIVGQATAALTVSGATNATPIVITTSAAHNLITGSVVTVAAVGGNTAANGVFVITVLSSTTFSLNGSVGNGAYTTGGTVEFEGVIQTGTGTSEVTVTGTPVDDYNVLVRPVTTGTIGTEGITFQISLDAGRTFGPIIALGTASTYAIPLDESTNTGLTLNFSAGTIGTGFEARFSTTAPQPDATGIAAALTALQESPYAQTGWGSMHIVGVVNGTLASAIGISGTKPLDGSVGGTSLAAGYIFTRAIVGARDAFLPQAWGGPGETETAWTAAVLADFASVSARRVGAAAGHYNMPSAFPTTVAGTPRYRRPLSWAHAAREVANPPQRHAGRVKDGALSQIVVDPVNDPSDGFIYRDERINVGFDNLYPGGAGRFTAARTRVGLGSTPGFYITNPRLLAPLGSDFQLFPQGTVMDRACDIAHQVAQQEVNDDLQTKPNGTLRDSDAKRIRNAILTAYAAQMIGVKMITGAQVDVDQTQNIQVTKTVVITITILGVAYVLQVDVSLAFANQLAA